LGSGDAAREPKRLVAGVGADQVLLFITRRPSTRERVMRWPIETSVQIDEPSALVPSDSSGGNRFQDNSYIIWGTWVCPAG
jgi:hypothetical protein